MEFETPDAKMIQGQLSAPALINAEAIMPSPTTIFAIFDADNE